MGRLCRLSRLSVSTCKNHSCVGNLGRGESFLSLRPTVADPDKNMTFSKPIMTDMPRPFPGNAQEIDFIILGV